MGMLKLSACDSTSICSTKPRENFKCEEYLWVDKWIEGREVQANEMYTLIKYELDTLEGTTIQKATLELQVDKWRVYEYRKYYELQMSMNEQDFDACEVTWQTKPLTTYYKTVAISRKELECGCISLDITDLVQLWSSGSTPNYGITLSSKHLDTTVRIYSCKTECGPRLTVDYEKNKAIPSVAIQVQVANRPLEIVDHEAQVLFDKVVTMTPSGITYNPASGQITISQVGYYIGEWWVAVGGAEAIPEINFSLQNITTQTLIEASAPVGVVSQPSGNAIFHINTVPQTLVLINNSKSKIQFGTLTIQASLIIAKI